MLSFRCLNVLLETGNTSLGNISNESWQTADDFVTVRNAGTVASNTVSETNVCVASEARIRFITIWPCKSLVVSGSLVLERITMEDAKAMIITYKSE